MTDDDYLTAEGQAAAADLQLIADNGFDVDDRGSFPLPAHAGATARARGAGTTLVPNA